MRQQPLPHKAVQDQCNRTMNIVFQCIHPLTCCKGGRPGIATEAPRAGFWGNGTPGRGEAEARVPAMSARARFLGLETEGHAISS